MNTASTAIASAVVEARAITRAFRAPGGTIRVLHGIDLNIKPGEFVALRGRSGSGKTTLLHILVGLDNPTQGTVCLLGHELADMNDNARAALRRRQIGLLFQNAHLIPTLTALENVELTLRMLNVPAGERNKRALEALEQVSLRERANHRGLELSGGEQQRVALARAL
ncbi:MAG TPA: ATP-binding cassette domain-containing protein, partial [Ktedonobacteraceae bacterium]